jgi:arylsulfatase A-like enzyme
MDIYSTSLALAGAELEKERIVDGYDLTESLKGKAKSPREIVYYYRGTKLMALRKGPWKAHFATQESYTGNNKRIEHDPPVLYNLEVDPSEKWDVAEQHPEVIAEIKAAADAHKETVVAVPSQLEIPLPK